MMSLVVLAWRQLIALSTTAVFVPCSNWRMAGALKSVKATWEIRGKSGYFSAVPAIQTSDDGVTVGQAAALEGYNYAADGKTYGNKVSISIVDKKLARFGYLVKLSQGTTIDVAAVQCDIEVETVG